MNKEKIVISIVSHGQCYHLKKLISSLELFLKYRSVDVQIVITHNLPPKDTTNSDKFKITSIFNLNPKGFGQNHNTVFEHHQSRYFVVVNPDIILFEQLDLDKLAQQLEYGNVDVTSPIILNPDSTVADYKRSDLTFKNLVLRTFFKYNVKKFDWYAGMFLIFRSESFSKLRGFDPKFFMYIEDCDICARARSFNMNVQDTTSARVIHNAQRSSRKNIRMFGIHTVSLIKYWATR